MVNSNLLTPFMATAAAAAALSTTLLSSPIQSQPIQGPTATRPYNLIYHEPTRSCLVTANGHSPPSLGPCSQSDLWYYTPQRFLTIKGTYFCLQPLRSGAAPRLAITCYVEDSQWTQLADDPSRLVSDDTGLCLDVGHDGTSVLTNPCVARSDGQSFQLLTAGKDGRVLAVAGEP